MRLPNVKNKYAAPENISVAKLLEGPARRMPHAGACTEALLASAKSAAQLRAAPLAETVAAGQLQSREADKIAALEFKRARSEFDSRTAETRPHKWACKVVRDKVKPVSGRRNVCAVLKVRRAFDWPRRRLLHIAIAKGQLSECPLARLPQGFAHEFVNLVFSFI